KLPFCSHMCVEMCHPGPCPKPTQCRKKVTVRCACLRLKKEWLCSQVQSATAKAAANGASNPSSSIDCSTNASSSGGGGGGGRLRESMVGYKGGTASSSRSSRGLGGFDLKQMLL
ncbi:unnamed protein product, partial [Closterium sp. NIES-64]